MKDIIELEAPMFGESYQKLDALKRRRWTFGASTGLQVLLIVSAILAPLVDYYELPQTDLVAYLLPAPPPAPPPPPPPLEVVAGGDSAPVAPEVFESAKLTVPVTIPDKVALIEEQSPTPSYAGVIGGVPGGVAGGQMGGVLGSILQQTSKLAPAPPPPPVAKPSRPIPVKQPEQITVSSEVQKAKLLRQVQPVYPALAIRARIQGTVKLQALIGKDGRVRKLDVVEGHPLLIPAALEAVKQWQYRPTLLNGKAFEVVTQIHVHFELAMRPT